MLLRESEVFGNLSDAVRARLADELQLRTAAAGDVVIRQGDPADGLYLVAGGRLQVVYDREDGESVVLREEGYGAVTGEMALVNDAPRSAERRRAPGVSPAVPARTRASSGSSPPTRRRCAAITSVLVRKLAATAQGRRSHQPRP